MALTNENIVQLLKDIEIFSEFKNKQLIAFAKSMKKVILNKGDTLFNKGDNDNALYIIGEGCVQIHDKNYIFTTLTSKQFFGEYSLIDSASRSATVTAVHNTELYELNKESFDYVTSKNPELWKNVLVALIKRLRNYNILEEKLTSRTLDVQKKKYHIEREKDFIDQQKKDLEAINNSKDKFLTIIAHDLKTPLLNINSISENIILQHGTTADKSLLVNVEQIKKFSSNASSLLDNLLQWSRSQSGNMKINFRKVNVHKIINEAIELYECVAENKGVSIENNISEKHFAYIDNDMITTVLRNSISNAIKFSYQNGKIDINISEIDEMLRIEIKDYGVGIEIDKLEKLFRIDERPESKTDDEIIGIGLLLCKEFVLKNGGNIWLNSAIGKGTSVTFSIPKAL